MISLIVAYDLNRGIGYKGKLPWDIKSELERFKNLTTNNIVIMGRKTFEDIGKPLSNRMNIVLSKTLSLSKHIGQEDLFIVKSFDEAMEIAKKYQKDNKEIFIIGGVSLYERALPIVNKMYISKIFQEYKCDTFFPDFNETLFDVKLVESNVKPVRYDCLVYTRKKL